MTKVRGGKRAEEGRRRHETRGGEVREMGGGILF